MESEKDEEGYGGFRSLADWVGDKEFIVGDKFGLADAVAAALSVAGYVDVRFE
jgi:glutathione S-transferase